MERNPNRQSAETPNGQFKLTGNERNLYDVARCLINSSNHPVKYGH